MKDKISLQSWGILFLLAIIWGSSFILIKKAVAGLDPVLVASLRIFCAFIFFVPIILSNIKTIPVKQLKYFLLAGCIGNLIPSFMFAISMPHMESTVSGILNSLSPLFTLITGILIWKQQFTFSKVAGVVVGLGGCLILVIFKGTNFEFNVNYYALMVVFATFLYGLNTNILKTFFQDVNPLQVASLSFLMIGPIAGTVFFSYGGWNAVWESQVSMQAAGYVVLLALISSAISLVLFTKLIQKTSAIFSASVTYLIPIVALFWGFMANEQIGLVQFVGMGIVLVGVFLVRK